MFIRDVERQRIFSIPDWRATTRQPGRQRCTVGTTSDDGLHIPKAYTLGKGCLRKTGRGGDTRMSWASKLVVGVLTALAMMLLTFALPRGGMLRDTAVVQFPMTVGIWAIFVLLFVKLK